jgi:hypothetical protein
MHKWHAITIILTVIAIACAALVILRGMPPHRIIMATGLEGGRALIGKLIFFLIPILGIFYPLVRFLPRLYARVSIVGWIYDPDHSLSPGMYVDVPHLDCLLLPRR